VLLDVAQQAAQEAALHARRLHEPGQLRAPGERYFTLLASVVRRLATMQPRNYARPPWRGMTMHMWLVEATARH
jgi:hypothetical protein